MNHAKTSKGILLKHALINVGHNHYNRLQLILSSSACLVACGRPVSLRLPPAGADNVDRVLDAANTLVRKLDSIAALTEDDRESIRTSPIQVNDIRANQDVARQGDRPSRCCLMVAGASAIFKVTLAGKRQIMAFQIAGDIPDLLSLHLGELDSGISTITASTVAFIRHEDVRALCHRSPRVSDALWRSTLIDAAIFREWIANIGQRAAPSRVAHVLCEFLARMEAVGLSEGDACDFPVSQTGLADATGMTPVHINRTLQDLRRLGLITLHHGRLVVLLRNQLTELAEFDPKYLHLN